MFDVKHMEFADRDDARLWIIHNQLGRRNIHDLDRAALLEEEEKIVASKARERQASGINQYTDMSLVEKFPQPAQRTRDIMGAKMGVSGKQYEKLKTINKKASPEVKQQIRDGKKSINAAFNEIKERERKQDRQESVKQLQQAVQDHSLGKTCHKLTPAGLATSSAKELGVSGRQVDKQSYLLKHSQYDTILADDNNTWCGEAWHG